MIEKESLNYWKSICAFGENVGIGTIERLDKRNEMNVHPVRQAKFSPNTKKCVYNFRGAESRVSLRDRVWLREADFLIWEIGNLGIVTKNWKGNSKT